MGFSINDVALKCFQSFWLDRKQYVEIPYSNQNNQVINVNSSLKSVNYGVSQTLILGLILLLCYLKVWLPSVINIQAVNYVYAILTWLTVENIYKILKHVPFLTWTI